MLVGRSFFSQIMSLHHSDQMSQRSQVSRVTLLFQVFLVLRAAQVRLGSFWFRFCSFSEVDSNSNSREMI